MIYTLWSKSLSWGLYIREAEPLCAENIGLKDISRSRRVELISRGELIMYYRPRVVHFNSFERNKQFAPINPDFHQELSWGFLQLRLILSCGWPDFRGLNTNCGWFCAAVNSRSGSWIRFATVSSAVGWIQVTTESSSSGSIQVRADSILRLNPTADLSSGSWIQVATVSSSAEWIQVTTDSILRLTLAQAAEKELWLIPSSSWL